MRFFIYEYLTAQGLGRVAASQEHGMYREGRAMRDALIEDFQRLPASQLLTTADSDTPFSPEDFEKSCRNADWTVLIAPAFDDCLGRLAEVVQRVGGCLLGPTIETIRLVSDKFALFKHWREHGVPTPATSDREPTGCEAFPVVWKPRAGAGSTMTFLLSCASDVPRARALRDSDRFSGPMILQEYVPGLAASSAFLCGPAGHFPLLPATQTLSQDGRFRYRGGTVPLPAPLATRAVSLGQRALSVLSGLSGFVGVDLVLGEDPNGSQDFAIEINPRLTTSYLGLRKLARFNLAEAMLQAALGRLHTPLCWENRLLEFTPDGDSGMDAGESKR
jgi:predicted ATP-grasp superfamily ATP-dependent carboligase